jgi:hypothetical protein
MTKQKRAFTRVLSGGAFLGVLGLISASPARATDANMLNAPSATEQQLPFGNNPLIVVRRPNGASVCMYVVNSGFSWNCSELGAPSGGVTTGPSVTIMPKTVGSPGVAFTFVFVRNGNNFYEKHLQNQGTAWTNWSTSMVGPPPSGVTPNSALVASHGNQTISVAFRDTNNRVWVKYAPARTNDALPVFNGWAEAAADNTTSAPSPALSNSDEYVFALGPASTIRWSTCGFPTCFASWSNVPNFNQAFNEGVQTLSVTDGDTDFDTWVYMVATHQGNVYFDTLDVTTATEFGSEPFASPPGKAADSAPAAVGYLSADMHEPLVVVHMNDGHWWTFDTNVGGPWQQLPATP